MIRETALDRFLIQFETVRQAIAAEALNRKEQWDAVFRIEHYGDSDEIVMYPTDDGLFGLDEQDPQYTQNFGDEEFEEYQPDITMEWVDLVNSINAVIEYQGSTYSVPRIALVKVALHDYPDYFDYYAKFCFVKKLNES